MNGSTRKYPPHSTHRISCVIKQTTEFIRLKSKREWWTWDFRCVYAKEKQRERRRKTRAPTTTLNFHRQARKWGSTNQPEKKKEMKRIKFAIHTLDWGLLNLFLSRWNLVQMMMFFFFMNAWAMLWIITTSCKHSNELEVERYQAAVAVESEGILDGVWRFFSRLRY